MNERTNVCVQPTAEYAQAQAENADRWVAACGGHEEPFTHDGTEWLYVWNPSTGDHGYLNLGTDIVSEEYR